MYKFNFKKMFADFFAPLVWAVAYFLSTATPPASASTYSLDIFYSQENRELYGYKRKDCQNYSHSSSTRFCSSLTQTIAEDKLAEHAYFSTLATTDHSHILKLRANNSNAHDHSAEPQLFPATLTLVVPQTTEEDETALSLNKTKRREVQIRLTLLGFDTRGSDGIFGPRSREAIEKWQAANSYPETGFLNMQQYKTILSTSDTAYEEWKRKQPKLRRVKVCKRGAFGALVDCRFEYR